MTPEQLAARGLRVRELDFKEGKHYGSTGRTLLAVGIFGAVEVTTGWENGKASAHRAYTITEWFPTEAEAVSFLQADYTARIIAALEETPE